MSGLTSGRILSERFTLIRPLRRGDEVELWLVRDEVLDERMVAKILLPVASPDSVALLQRECRQARRLVHPNIVRVYDLRRSDGYEYITMAWVEGGDLSSLRGAEPATILRTLLSIADALSYAHEKGVIHRDLKSGNVVCDAEGRPHLLDFGIAAVSPDEGEPALEGGGTLHSASPQQLAGAEPAPSDDIYSFGVLLYELLGGHPPFWPEITEERVRSEVPDPPRSKHPLPPRLVSLTASLLAKSPAARPRDMATVKRKLEEIVDQLPQSAPVVESGDNREVRLTPPPRIPPIRPITPPASRSPAARPRKRSRWGTVLFILAVVAFVVFDVVVLVPWLRERLREEGAGDEPASVVAAPEAGSAGASDDLAGAELDPSMPGGKALFREQAEELLGRAVELLKRLEGTGVRSWAAEEYRAAERHVAEGDDLLTAGDFLEARDAYADAVARLSSIDSSMLEVLQQKLHEGSRALADGDSAAAAAAFELALKIAPGDASAAAGLKRSGVLDEVVLLRRRGADAEREGRLDAAAQAYREAINLDPMSQESRDALARVLGRLSEDAFSSAMSDGLVALGLGDYEAALEGFRRAEALRPGSAEAKDGMAQAEGSLKLEAMSQHRGRAADLEASEQWAAAAEQFGAVLELDPTIRFAQLGRERCLERAELERRILFHLDNPNRLTSDAVYTEAVDLFDDASGIDPIGPRHRDQLERLDRLLETAGKRVTILLESDNLTEITIYKVGRLGTFTRRELALRPGTYTVVGSRRGYRDVRRQLVVKAGADHEPLVVRCQEKV